MEYHYHVQVSKCIAEASGIHAHDCPIPLPGDWHE